MLRNKPSAMQACGTSLSIARILKTRAVPSLPTQLCVSLETTSLSFSPRSDIWKSSTFSGKLKYGRIKKNFKIVIPEKHFRERTDVQIPCKVNKKEK